MKPERQHTYWGQKHPKDWLLAHNPVQPVHVLQPHGYNGFRVMWIPPGYGWRVCKCGWRPDLGAHYANPKFRMRKITAPVEIPNDDYAELFVLGLHLMHTPLGQLT
jgi:hypothetical protein